MHKPAKNTARKNSGEIVIPDKLYFRIGEVSRLCGLPTYVLRFWETEFPQLKPPKSNTGQRTYRRADVENVVRIKKLLYDEGFTIAGARAQLKAEGKKKQAPLPFLVQPDASLAELKQLRQGLRDILWLLNNRAAARNGRKLPESP
jgi:DNA-binding transcriptional MerR regulator